jgi:DNA-binding beta-propeller fold protein YncE
MDDGGGLFTLANPQHASALRFIGGRNDLLVADDGSDTVGVVQDVPGAALWQPLAGAADGVAGPIGLDVSLDGARLVVANARAGNILVLSAAGAAAGPPPVSFPCPCNPAGLGRLNGNAVFLLNGISDNAPLWIFDGDSATQRVVFIPAASDQ